MKAYRFTGVVALSIALAAGASRISREGDRWWSHVEVLAGDAMQGRAPGTPGFEAAAAYVVQQFENAHVRPAGTSGYYQPVRFRSRTIDESHSRLSISVDGKPEPFPLGEAAYFVLRSEPRKCEDAGAVFIGYGLKIPELQIDDFAGIDLKGKFAVYLNGIPSKVPGPLAAHSRSAAERRKNLISAGAVGAIPLTNPRNSDLTWARLNASRLKPELSLEDGTEEPLTGISVNPQYADRLLQGTGHNLAELFSLDADHQRLPQFALKVRVTADPRFSTGEVGTENVVGWIPGSDPELKKECVVVTAHLDHLGVGKAAGTDGLYNGAMDNASGVGALLEAGRMLARSKLRRSLILVALTGEENGLLGSRYFAAHPTRPELTIVANLNVDMFLPIIPLNAMTVYGIDESTLGSTFRRLAEETGVVVEPDRESDRNHFVRSDQYSFILSGVPALAFKIAAPPGSRDEQMLKDWTKTRYHQPSDDLKQPVDRQAAGKFIGLLDELIVRVANQSNRPQWFPTSFFARFAPANTHSFGAAR